MSFYEPQCYNNYLRNKNTEKTFQTILLDWSEFVKARFR
jgi:hypothetical protein